MKQNVWMDFYQEINHIKKTSLSMHLRIQASIFSAYIMNFYNPFLLLFYFCVFSSIFFYQKPIMKLDLHHKKRLLILPCMCDKSLKSVFIYSTPPSKILKMWSHKKYTYISNGVLVVQKWPRQRNWTTRNRIKLILNT